MSDQQGKAGKPFRMEWWDREELEALRRRKRLSGGDQLRLTQLRMYENWEREGRILGQDRDSAQRGDATG